jgi:large subunit ribosomal protein L25
MLKLTAEPRETFGKKLKTARAEGRMPVIVYGNKKEASALFVSAKDFKRVWKEAGESSMVTIEAGKISDDVLIHEVTFHPVSGEPLHADLLVVDKTKKIETEVPLRFEGVAPAVKDLGGTLVKVLHELKIEVLPTHIPHEIVVDISTLANLDSQILVSELKIPAGVTVLNEADEVAASIAVAKEEPVEAAPVDLSAIEVEKKGKEPDSAEATTGEGEGGGKKEEKK